MLVSRKRNTFALIHTLSTELLVAIIEMTLDYEPEPKKVWFGHEALLLVCRYWNDVVTNTPSLWAYIRKTTGIPNARIVHALEKSKDHPLEIKKSWTPDRRDREGFFKAIVAHAYRWRNASLFLERSADSQRPITTLSAPLLESISLSIDPDIGWTHERPLNIFRGQPQIRLRELFLGGVPIPWSPTFLCNLKALGISDMKFLGPSFDQLFAILAACPGLESLAIQDVNIAGGTSAVSRNTVHMPALARLELGIRRETTSRILATIRAANCKFGSLKCVIQGDPLETLFTPAISHFFKPMGSAVDSVSFDCHSDCIFMTWRSSWHIDLMIGSISLAQGTLNWLRALLPPNSPAVPLDVTISTEDPHSVEDILATMANTEGVHRVAFKKGVSAATASLWLFATGSSVEGMTTRPFPDLEEIRFEESVDDNDWEHLIGMLRRRQGETDARAGVQPLKPVRRLRFGTRYVRKQNAAISNFRLIYWPNRLEEVRKLLGPEGELVWYGRTVTEDGALEGQPTAPFGANRNEITRFDLRDPTTITASSITTLTYMYPSTETPDDTNDTFAHLLHRLEVLMSQHTDDRELDRRTLLQCDEELGTLRAVQKQLERRVAFVCRKRNSFAPISTLPPELLVTIFAAALHNGGTVSQSNHGMLMLVCHYWNHLIDNTPSLWTKIQNHNWISTASLSRALEKSRESPLEITCNFTWAVEPTKENEFFSTILPHIHRWREALFWLSGESQALKLMPKLSAPLLESLSLTLDKYQGWAGDHPLDIFGDQPPPRLRELSLTVIPIPWNPKFMCNLVVLSIAQMQRLGPTLDQLLVILLACPSLEALSIRDVAFSDGVGSLSSATIHMSALYSLELQELPWDTTNRILAAIHAPNCQSGILNCYIHGHPLETLFTSDISHFFDHIRSGGNAGSLVCEFDRAIITWAGSWYISLSVENIRFAKDTLHWLSASPEPNSPAVPLHMMIYMTNPLLIDDNLEVMADMETLNKITFGADIPVTGALRLLATGNLAVGNACEPFPALKEISIDTSFDDDDWLYLLAMLQRRQGKIEGRAGVQKLKPLRKLGFGGGWFVGDDDRMIAEFRLVYWPNRLKEVRRLLGPDGELEWYGRTVTEDGVLEARAPPQHWT
ncbi:hypothetical protein FS837_012554, partial [Tulasnella sp. UAMH 9824]